MKKLIVALLIVIGGGLLFYSLGSGPVDKTNGVMDIEKSVGENVSFESEGEVYKYQISDDSQVSYTVVKKFLEKEDEAVTGTTSEITGFGWYAPDTGEIQGNAKVDLTTLNTGNEKRDKHVADLFSPTYAMITFSQNGIDNEILMSVSQNVGLNANVEMNGVSKTVMFNVKTNVTEENFSVKGSGTVKLGDFSLEQPSILNVYTADDEVVINVDIKGTRVEN